MSENGAYQSKTCINCCAEVATLARICPNCGTRQNPSARKFFFVASVLGVFATAMSIISAGAGLAPQAAAFLFPSFQPTMFRMEFDGRDLNTRKFGTFDLYNSGNNDVYAISLMFEPIQPEFAKLKPVRIGVYSVIPAKDGVEEKIALVGSQSRTGLPFRLLIEDQYQLLEAHLIENAMYRSRCFALMPLNARKNIKPPEDGKFRNDIAVTELVAKIEYINSANSSDDIKLGSVTDFYVEAAVYFRRSCLVFVGGENGLNQILAQ